MVRSTLSCAASAPSSSSRSNCSGEHNVAVDYFETLRIRYDEFLAEAQRRRDEEQGDHWALILYYTPAEEMVHIAQVIRYTGFDTLQMQGEDQAGNPCDVIVHPRSAQVVLKLISPPPPEIERRPVGFRVVPSHTPKKVSVRRLTPKADSPTA